MTEYTKTGPLSDAWAFNRSIDDVMRAPVGAVAVNSNGHGVYADARKTLSF